jgi:hypothetical protein
MSDKKGKIREQNVRNGFQIMTGVLVLVRKCGFGTGLDPDSTGTADQDRQKPKIALKK